MMPSPGTPRLVINIKNVHVAEVLSDEQGANTVYDTPTRLAGVTDTIDVTDNTSQTQYYGDGIAAASAQSKGTIDVTFSRQNMDDAQMAYLMGNTISNNWVEDGQSDSPSYFATMYELELEDGGSKFVQIDKVRFQENTQGGTTKSDTLEYQPLSLVGSGIARLSDGRRKRSRTVAKADVETVRTAFFANANDQTAPALTVTEVPADASTGIAVDADITLTFSNEILDSTVTNQNIKLFTSDYAVEVPLTLTLDAAGVVVTGVHADLDATTEYVIVLTDGVNDIYGQGISQITTFTTA